MFNFIKKVVCQTKNSIVTFKDNPLNSLGHLIPVAIGLIAFISFVVAYVSFITGGGYSKQIEIIKLHGIDGVEEAFTNGTVDMINRGVVPIIINALFLLQIVVMSITYMRYESKRMKRIVLVDLIAMGTAVSFLAGIFILFGCLDSGKRILADRIPVSVIRTAVIIAIAIFVVALIVFAILQLIAKSRWMLGYGLGVVLISHAVLPLLLFLLENVVPMVALVVVVAIFAGLFGVLLSCIGSGETGGGSHSSAGPKVSAPVRQPNKTQSSVKQPEVFNIVFDAQLWVERTMTGNQIVVPYKRDWNGEYKERIHYKLLEDVSLYDFKKGNVIIHIQGRTMTEKDLHYGNRF